MTDNQAIAELISIINDGYAAYSLPAPNQIRQAYQPKSHGTPSAAVCLPAQVDSRLDTGSNQPKQHTTRQLKSTAKQNARSLREFFRLVPRH